MQDFTKTAVASLQQKFAGILARLSRDNFQMRQSPEGPKDRVSSMNLHANLLQVQMGVLGLQLNIQNVLMHAEQNKESLAPDQRNKLIVDVIQMVNLLTELIQTGTASSYDPSNLQNA